MRHDRLARARADRDRSLRISEQVGYRVLERGRRSRRDEAAVEAVLEVISAGDGRGTGDDDRLGARHRLQEDGRRT